MEQLTLWSEEAPAKHFQSQAHEKGLMTCAANSCSNISELAQKLTRSGLSGKTFQVYFLPMVAETLQHCLISFQNSGVLAGEGGAWRVLDAQYFGVPQRRKRIFLVINTHDWRRAVNVLYDSASLQGDTCKAGQKAEVLRASRLERRLSGSNKVQCRIDTQAYAPTMCDACPTLLRHNRNDPPYVWGGGYPFRRLTAEECEALQGFPPGWTDCLRYRERIGVLGNSMAVPVMRWLGRRIETISKGAK